MEGYCWYRRQWSKLSCACCGHIVGATVSFYVNHKHLVFWLFMFFLLHMYTDSYGHGEQPQTEKDRNYCKWVITWLLSLRDTDKAGNPVLPTNCRKWISWKCSIKTETCVTYYHMKLCWVLSLLPWISPLPYLQGKWILTFWQIHFYFFLSSVRRLIPLCLNW